MKRTALVIIAIVFAMLIGWVDTHNDEVQATLLCLLVGTALLGVMDAKRAWLWALVLGLSIPLAAVVNRLLHPQVPHEAGLLDVRFFWIPLIPAFIGAYGGVLVRWLVGRASKVV